MVKPFPKLINFRHEEYRKKFKQMMSRKIFHNRYMSASSLKEIEMLDEVTIYVNRIGCSDFMMMQSPTYIRPTYEFLSSFSYDE